MTENPTISEASMGKILQEAMTIAKKNKKKEAKNDLKFAKESLGRNLLRVAELLKEARG